MSMTDKEIVDGAERMAKTMLLSLGFQTDEPELRKSKNPRAQGVWAAVGAMLEAYNGTDLESAVDNVDNE